MCDAFERYCEDLRQRGEHKMLKRILRDFAMFLSMGFEVDELTISTGPEPVQVVPRMMVEP